MERRYNGKGTGRQLVSLLLCLVMAAQLLPVTTAAEETAALAVSVTQNGRAVEQITVSQAENAAAEAVCTAENAAVQWQILTEAGWVDIYGADDTALTVSYALVRETLSGAGDAYVRCRAEADGETAVSDPVCVTAAHAVPVTQAEVTAYETAQAQERAAQLAETAADAKRAARRARRTAHTSEYVQISINYLDAGTGLPVYTGFSAQIERGTAYSNTVISPTYLGYAPYYNAAQPDITVPAQGEVDAPDKADSIVLAVTEDYDRAAYVVNVYYKAIDVPYAARFYFQNIHDDFYTEDVSLYQQRTARTGTIITNEMLAADAAHSVGFNKLYHYPEAVAADGSTVFECYYDRNYHLIKFDINGGYGTEPVYARYGTPFLVNEPTRHGYVFGGWDLVEENGKGDGTADTLPAAIPDENLSYIAIWTQAETTYTKVYWLQNADDDRYSYVGAESVGAISGETVSGGNDLTATTALCHLENDESHTHSSDCYAQSFRQYVYSHADEDVLVEGDGSTVVNVYYTRRVYTMRFFYAQERENGGDPKYYIVGGSTYRFGHQNDGMDGRSNQNGRPKKNGAVVNDVTSLLENVASSHWGEVPALPEINAPAGVTYTTGTLPESGYNEREHKFYYFEFDARYGADLSVLWPSEVFDKVEVSGAHTSNEAKDHMGEGQWGNYAYFAGWNGEYNIQYNWTNPNATIKCYYPILDEQLVYKDSFVTDERFADRQDPDDMNFLAFFDNGADISWSNPRQWIYKLYVETPAGQEGNRTFNGVSYDLYRTVYAADNNKTIADQTRPGLPGFVSAGERDAGWLQEDNGTLDDGRLSYTANLFYKRQSYNLALHNYSGAEDYEVPFEGGIDAYIREATGNEAGIPPYPATLEKDAYTFGGWYTSPGCYDGSEYVPGSTMPAAHLVLYAKWAPVQHDVRFFRTYDDMLAYEAGDTSVEVLHDLKVDHGALAEGVVTPEDTSGHDYVFGGWFYMKSHKKTAYTPLDMPIVRNMNVFADWGTHSAQPFIIHYVTLEAETDAAWTAAARAAALYNPRDNTAYTASSGGETRRYVYLAEDGGFHRTVADDSVGYAFQGTTRTFIPKAGAPLNQLYDDYNRGYYPTLASHSATIQYEGDKSDPTANVFTFTYVHAENIGYTVEYRYLSDDRLIPDAPGGGTVEKTTQMTVVTERFAVIANYIPDAFYKRLVLAVEKDENGKYVGSKDNVVTFYYTPDVQNAYYAVHHMLQDLDAAGDALTPDGNGGYVNYTEASFHTEGIGAVGSTQTIRPQTFSGFTPLTTGVAAAGGSTEQVTQGADGFTFTISADGTELYVFYVRNTQSYRVYHLTYGTDISDLAGLTYDPDDAAHKNGVLLPVETGTERYGTVVTARAREIDGMSCVSAAEQRISLRPQDEQNYIIFYYETKQYTVEYSVWPFGGGTVSRTIEVVSGTKELVGSTAAAEPGYSFQGWYLDEACTVPAPESMAAVTGASIRPKRDGLLTNPNKNVFYAKFMPAFGDLTITRANGTDDEGAGTQVFVYRITAADDADMVTYVTVTGNGSAVIRGLPCRRYIVEQAADWSWRYADAAQTVEVTEDGASAVFDGDAVRDQWLSGSSDAVCNRKG